MYPIAGNYYVSSVARRRYATLTHGVGTGEQRRAGSSPPDVRGVAAEVDANER